MIKRVFEKLNKRIMLLQALQNMLILIFGNDIIQLIRLSMTINDQLIREYQRAIKNSSSHVEIKENQLDIHTQLKMKNKSKKAIKHRNYNIIQKALIMRLPEPIHVTNFYNIIGLNEQTLSTPNCEESLVKTFFYLKNVQKIESRPRYLLLHLNNSLCSFPSVEYTIERFKSYGDMQYYNLANHLIQISGKMKVFKEIQHNQTIQGKNQQIQKYAEQMQNRMYMASSVDGKFVFSKTFLEALSYNPEQFAIETVKYKSCINEIFSSERYYDIVIKRLENFSHLLDLLNGHINLEALIQSTIFRFQDYLLAKNQKKLYCKLNLAMPNPMINVMQIEQIINESDQFGSFLFCKNKAEIEELKRLKKAEEIGLLSNLIALPKNTLPQNAERVASYRSINQGQLTNRV